MTVAGHAPDYLDFDPNYDAVTAIDWTFAAAATQGETHALHSYPAKFIPQIPRELIRLLHPGDDSKVLDPFCGSGTTLVEAAGCGIDSVGIDLHPLACLISKVKVTPLPPDAMHTAALRVCERAQSISATAPDIPRLDHWFEKEVQDALSRLTAAIDLEPGSDIRDALRVVLSSIIVRVSNQESDTRYAAVTNEISANGVTALFRKAAMNAASAIHETWHEHIPGRAQIINSDVLQVRPSDVDGPISLVVTSPPYPNAYEYWLYHKYRMYWLGMDPLYVRKHEIGARPHYFKTDPQTGDDFARQMSSVFELLSGVVVSGGHACFQIGTSVIHGQLIDNAEIIRRAATENAFNEVVRVKRNIPGSRSSFNASHGRIREETILVFRRSA